MNKVVDVALVNDSDFAQGGLVRLSGQFIQYDEEMCPITTTYVSSLEEMRLCATNMFGAGNYTLNLLTLEEFEPHDTRMAEEVIEDKRSIQEVLGLFYKEVPVTLTMQEYADFMNLTLEEVEEPGVIAVVIDPSGKHYVVYKEGNIEERE